MIEIRGRFVLAAALTAATFALGSLAFGASTGTSVYMPQGGASGSANGDYASTSLGSNKFYRYFIEVPSGLSRLRVQIFDADIGAGGTGEAASQRDRGRVPGTAAFSNTNVRYTLLDPTGKTRPTLFAIGNATTPPNSSWSVCTIQPPISSAVTTCRWLQKFIRKFIENFNLNIAILSCSTRSIRFASERS